MGGGPDRDPVSGEIEAGAAARVGDERKPRVDEIRVELLERQEDGPPGPVRLAHDRTRHAIPRREIAGRIVARHERLTIRVQEFRTLAAQRL